MAIRADAVASPDGDLFELLFPEGGEPRDDARRWTQLLTLVVDDARARVARPEADELRTAQRVLERTDLGLVLGALDDLLLTLFDSLLDRDSFFATRRPQHPWNEAWHQFAALAPSLAAPPAPGEPGLDLASRFVRNFDELASRGSGVQAARWLRRRDAWHIALKRVVATPSSLEAWLAETVPRALPHRIALTEARALCALERGAVRAAEGLLDAARELQALDPELAELGHLVQGLSDRTKSHGLRWSGALPTALVGLAESASTNPRQAPSHGRADTPESCSRRSIGASFAGLFLVDGQGNARLVEHEVAPGVANRVREFATSRSREWRSVDAPERQALSCGQPVVLRGASAFSDSYGSSVCVPLPDGAPAGWVQLNFEHGLVPSYERLRAFTAGLNVRAHASTAAPTESATHALPLFGARRELAESSELAWFDWSDECALPIGSKAQDHKCSAPTLERVARLGLGADADTTIEPLVLTGRTIGLVVGAQAVAVARDPRLVQAWQDARFVDWSFANRNLELAPTVAFGGIALDRFMRVARARADLELIGAPGVGKFTVASRLCFEAGAPAPVCVATEDELDALVEADSMRESPAWIVVQSPGRWSRRGQLRLATLPPGVRLVALTTVPLAERASSGGVEPALSARFAKLTLRVEPLAARRHELLVLAELLARRIARVEQWEAPSWTDEALACVWRQPWELNVRELDAVLYGALLEASDSALTLERIDHALVERGLIPVERIPTKDERAFDQALEATRLANGRVNKRRAATYLGWDRETVSAHARRREENGESQ